MLRISLLALLLPAVACSGKDDQPDAGADTFVWDTVPFVDNGARDTTTPPRDTSAPPADQATGADVGVPPDGAPGRCAAWSAWSCDESDPVLLCKASCAAGPLGLSCINSGDCVCGVTTTGSCGKFSGNSPCEVCQKAVAAGCCNP